MQDTTLCHVAFCFNRLASAVLTENLIWAEHDSFRHAWDGPVCFYTGRFLQLPFIQTVLFLPVFFFSKAAIFLLWSDDFLLD